MNRGDRAALDRLDKRPALGIVEPGPGTGRLSIQQAIRAKGIEPNHPVAHDLQANSADPRRRSPAAAIVYLGQGQKPTRLVRTLRSPRQSSQRRSVKITPQANRRPHGAPSKTRLP
jgi:hypothetical protein